jgi:hypothetical protein
LKAEAKDIHILSPLTGQIKDVNPVFLWRPAMLGEV